MIYKEFKVAFFRNFKEEQTLHIAIPHDNLTGSGLTYIVGENNAGKTSIIEALQKNDDVNSREAKYVIDSDIKNREEMHFTICRDLRRK